MRHAVVGLALAVCAVSSRASDGFVNVYDIPHNVSWNVIGNQLTHEIVNRTVHHWDIHAEEQRKAKARVQAAGLPIGTSVASQLAKGLSIADARKAELAYRQAFKYHELVIKKFNLPSGDLGVGIASSIAGAWMAYHNKPFPDQFYVPLVRQMQQRVNDTTSLRALSAAECAIAYEGLAIAGMMLASSQITWERNPQAPGASVLKQRMQGEGAQMLTQMLNVPPEQVAIGASGVTLLSATQR